MTIRERLKRAGANLLCLMMFLSGGWGGVMAYRESRPWLTDLFTLQEVRVTGLVHLTREEVLARLGLPADETLFTVSPAMLVRGLESHPWIKEAGVSRKFFHTVAVEITERRPAGVLRSAEATLVVDAEGHLLPEMPERETSVLPVLVGIEPGALIHGDSPARQAVQTGLKLAGLLGDTYQGRPEVDVSNPDNMVGSVQGLRFEFGATSFEEKWVRYHRIEHAVRARPVGDSDQMRNEIDLRYPGKVIVRERG
jgi:cell division protein FtsQ